MTSGLKAGLPRLGLKFLHIMDVLTEVIGRSISILAIFMMLLTCTVVVLRYVFETGSVMLQESVIYMHGTIFMLGAAYALRHDAHVRVDFLYARYSPRGRAIVNLVGHLFLLVPLCIFIIHISWDYVARSWRIMEGSREVGGLPAVFLLKTLIPASAALLLIQALNESLRLLLHWKDPAEVVKPPATPTEVAAQAAPTAMAEARRDTDSGAPRPHA